MGLWGGGKICNTQVGGAFVKVEEGMAPPKSIGFGIAPKAHDIVAAWFESSLGENIRVL